MNVTNFHTSWRDGLAFCALIAHFEPTALDFSKRSKDKMVENLTVAFQTAEKLGIPALLDVQGLLLPSPFFFDFFFFLMMRFHNSGACTHNLQQTLWTCRAPTTSR